MTTETEAVDGGPTVAEMLGPGANTDLWEHYELTLVRVPRRGPDGVRVMVEEWRVFERVNPPGVRADLIEAAFGRWIRSSSQSPSYGGVSLLRVANEATWDHVHELGDDAARAIFREAASWARIRQEIEVDTALAAIASHLVSFLEREGDKPIRHVPAAFVGLLGAAASLPVVRNASAPATRDFLAEFRDASVTRRILALTCLPQHVREAVVALLGGNGKALFHVVRFAVERRSRETSSAAPSFLGTRPRPKTRKLRRSEVSEPSAERSPTARREPTGGALVVLDELRRAKGARVSMDGLNRALEHAGYRPKATALVSRLVGAGWPIEPAPDRRAEKGYRLTP